MNLTALISALVQAGATPDMILAAVKSQDEDKAKKREDARQRKIKERGKSLENNDHVTVTECDVTVTTCDTPSSSSPLPLLSPTPPYNSNPPSSPTPEIKNTRANEIQDFMDRSRLQPDLPNAWLEDCRTEMGWNESTIADVWTKFSGHWKRKIGHSALKTQEEWGAEWRTWYRSSHIKQQKSEKPEEQKNKGEPIVLDKTFYKRMGIQHPIHNPEGLRA